MRNAKYRLHGNHVCMYYHIVENNVILYFSLSFVDCFWLGNPTIFPHYYVLTFTIGTLYSLKDHSPPTTLSTYIPMRKQVGKYTWPIKQVCVSYINWIKIRSYSKSCLKKCAPMHFFKILLICWILLKAHIILFANCKV